MIQRIDPPIPVRTPKGNALAHFLIDYGIESELFWVVFQDDTGECWTWNNKDVRAQKNITAGRENISPFYDPEDVAIRVSDPEDVHFTTPANGEYNCSAQSSFKGESGFTPHLHLTCRFCQRTNWVPLDEAKNWRCPFCIAGLNAEMKKIDGLMD